MDRRAVGALLGGLGLTAAAAVGVKVAGRRIRGRQRPEFDALFEEPPGVSSRVVATSDGARIHVVEAGEGPPVVLLHGVVLQWWVWNPVIHLLSSNHRVIAWDMRGHGRSATGSDGVTLHAIGRDLVEVLDELEVVDAVVVGHSMGGMAMGRFAVDYPEVLAERVAGLVFLASAATEITPRALTGYLGAASGVLAGVAGRAELPIHLLWRPGDLSASLVRVAFGHEPSSVAIEAVRRMIAEVPAVTSIQAGEAILAHDLTDSLGVYHGPAMVIVGEEDRLTPPRLAERVVGLLPQAELHRLEGIGHQVMQEAPDELAGLLSRFAVDAPQGNPTRRASPAWPT